MHAAILLVTIPPRHTPGDLQYFSFLEVYSPLPGTQKETIPPPPTPELLINHIYIRFLLHPLMHTKGNRPVFTTFMNVFLEGRITDVVM